MNPSIPLANRQLLRDLAVARAPALRRQAVHDFWAGAGRLLARVPPALRRLGARTTEGM